MVTRSIGSCTLPSTSRVTDHRLAHGELVAPRRICSTRMARAAPRPCTSQASGRSVGSTRIVGADKLAVEAVLDQARGALAPLTRPAIGLVLMPIVIEIARSSTVISVTGRR